MTPLVSILIPCYNAAPWLAATLDSALAQSWTRTEIILVDDGSTDSSLAIAEAYAGRGLRVLSQPNRGASAARNRALREARGDYIQYLDADDLLAPEKIARQLATLNLEDRRVLLSGRWGRFSDHLANATFSAEALEGDFIPTDFLVRKITAHAMMHPAAWLVSRELIEAAGPWDERLSLDDDGEYFSRVVLSAQRILFCADAVSYYRSGLQRSLSRSRSDRAWESQFLSVELRVSQLLAVENSPRTRQACADALQRLVFEIYPRLPSLRQRALVRVAELGGSALHYEAGPRYQLAARLFGWKTAKRLRNLLR